MANKRYACIGLYNPKSPENVGSVMRAAGCYGVASVFYTGKRYERARDFITDTKKIHQDIPLIGIEDLKSILPLGCIPVAVELVDGARALPEYTHPDRALYIFGPEDGSLDQDIRDWCEDVVYIPTEGCRIWPQPSTWCSTTVWPKASIPARGHSSVARKSIRPATADGKALNLCRGRAVSFSEPVYYLLPANYRLMESHHARHPDYRTHRHT
ncbi:hypothetical protein ALP90_00126 [Pseudomonas amygdali pv. ulmi]|uniref:tRNA/rRNA methyltransferase SpoU type domain-containing protein n=1 Tax=Pseudomonas amygdali pv. ulmi TaxID=251720 RepID=A0A3M4SZX0_PSEA0|nr:hypothetical protein ALP90_00126 [Pseudomonas amygdali pv. ulmi]